jgi:inner membrane protein YidH
VDRSEAESAHRTQLAAERTWLAWWRTGLATAAAGLGVGRLLPAVVSGAKWPYVLLGACYCAVALGLMVIGGIRQARVRDALGKESFEDLDRRLVSGFTLAGVVITAATFAVVLAGV